MHLLGGFFSVCRDRTELRRNPIRSLASRGPIAENHEKSMVFIEFLDDATRSSQTEKVRHSKCIDGSALNYEGYANTQPSPWHAMLWPESMLCTIFSTIWVCCHNLTIQHAGLLDAIEQNRTEQNNIEQSKTQQSSTILYYSILILYIILCYVKR